MWRSRRLLAVLAILALAATACGGDDPGTADDTTAGAATTDGQAVEPKDGPTITIGSFNFPESETLAWIYALGLEAQGYGTDTALAIGSREVTQPALADGQIDMIVEYTGNALRFQRDGEDVELRDPREVYDALSTEYEDDGLTVTTMSDAQDVDGLAVTRAFAEQHDLQAISDLKAIEDQVVFGAGPECPARLSCLKGYQEIYGIDFADFKELDVAGPISVAALKSGEVQAANLFTTQGVVAANDFVLLEDDMEMQLPQNIVPVLTQEIVDAYGDELIEVLDAITAKITTEGLTELNKLVEVDKRDSEQVAQEWLEENGLA